ncbi:hypothetical protein V6N13_110818 [Hibiscus sabdariffa]
MLFLVDPHHRLFTCFAEPIIHSLNGISGLSSLLRKKTPTDTTKNTIFQIMSRTTSDFKYTQSHWFSSSCSVAVSRTSMEGSRIILRLMARRRNRAASWRLW